jgi:hypothetical protein
MAHGQFARNIDSASMDNVHFRLKSNRKPPPDVIANLLGEFQDIFTTCTSMMDQDKGMAVVNPKTAIRAALPSACLDQ